MSSFLAKRLDAIEPSPTLAITALANEMKAAGKDVVGFGAGEPDFDTPTHIKDAVKKAIDDGYTKYSPAPGYLSLRELICEKIKRDNHVDLKPQNVIVSTGGKQVLYNLFMAILNPGDEVIIPTPYWVSYKDMVLLGEAKPVIIENSIENGFKLSPERLEAAITSKTKAFIMNSPSNPTGATYTREDLEGLAAVLEKHPHVLIITDDIYEKLIYDGLEFFNLPMVNKKLIDQTVIVNGFSKAFSMTGWRLGYAGCTDLSIIKAMSKLQGQSTSGANSFAQKGAEVALSAGEACIEEMKVEFVKRRDYIVQALSECQGLKVYKPQGAFYVFPDMSELAESPGFKKLQAENPDEKSPSKLFSKVLLEQEMVAVVPGIAFGYENGFRMSYATSMEQIKKGTDRIQKFIAALWK